MESRGSKALGRPVAEQVKKKKGTDRRSGRDRLIVLATQAALSVLILGTWQLLVENEVLREARYGSPFGTYSAVLELYRDGVLWKNSWATLKATLWAFGIGSAAGIVIGLTLGTSEFLDRVFSPLVSILNSMPRIAFAPLLIVWFGLTMWAKVWMGASLAVFIMLLNTRAGARGVDRDLRRLAKVTHQNTRRYFLRIVLPSSLPSIFAGLRLSVVYCLLGVIASEMIVAIDGLGTLVVRFSSTTLDVNAVFGTLLVIALVAALLSSVIEVTERRLLHWQMDPGFGRR